MTFISYAQNYEDVMLFRALRGVERGFYIDVGAQDPVEDSVTRAFYERGWHGINIEPVEHWYRRLVEDRPHDINLRVAVSDQPGELELFEVEGTGLSTTDETFAGRHRAQGLTVHAHRVDCVTLDSICAEHKVGTVHFLKVDCEGAEEPALRSMPLERIRPWIIVVEASEPNSTKPTHQQWEHLLTGRGYGSVYADGINRYYLADEHPELRVAFVSPPNVLDDFMRAGEDRAHRRVHELHAALLEARSIERSTRAEAERDFFRSENVRREVALTQSRELIGSLQKQATGLGTEIARLQGDVAHLGERSAIERQALQADIADRVEIARALEHEIVRLQADIVVFGEHRAALEREITRLQAEGRGQGDEIARLRQEYRDNAAEYARVQAAFEQMRGSRSWRLTVPLRAAGRGIGAAQRAMVRGTKAVLRRPARRMRPTLRRWAQHPAPRRLAFALMGGRDSAVARRVRVFLFGPLPTVTPHHIARIGSELDSSVYSRRERVALSALQDAMPSAATDARE